VRQPERREPVRATCCAFCAADGCGQPGLAASGQLVLVLRGPVLRGEQSGGLPVRSAAVCGERVPRSFRDMPRVSHGPLRGP
jgi:hypothetical protein